MAAPKVASTVGFRNCQLFLLDSDGTIAALSPTTAYEGMHLSGVRTLVMTTPQPQQINHLGDDRVLAVDQLPPTEAVTAELTSGKADFLVESLLTGVAIQTDGERSLFPRYTDLQGSEKQVCMLAYQQGLDTTPGAAQVRVWKFRLIPIALIVPGSHSMEANPIEQKYMCYFQFSSLFPWGVPLDPATDKASAMQFADGIAVGKPKLISWIGNAVIDDFVFPVAYPSRATASVQVWSFDTVTKVATDITLTITGLTSAGFTTPSVPSATTKIFSFYEY